MKQHKRKREIVGDHIYYLSHRLRRPLANFVSVFEILKSSKTKGCDRIDQALLKKALADFDEAITEYSKTFNKTK